LRIVDCGSSIDGLTIADCRLTDCRLAIADDERTGQLSIPNPAIDDRHSTIRRSAIVNPQPVNPQSTIRNRQ
jgi:hypothetical protein